jgi:transcription-repair coupling factor (superfamily II helicase)
LGILRREPGKTAPLVDMLSRDTLLVLDEPDKLAEAAAGYARQIPAGDKFFVEWRHTLESGLTTVALTGTLAIDAPSSHINLGLAALDAFRPLDTRAPEPEVAEQMRRSFFEQMQQWTHGGYALHVFCSNDGEKQRFEELWREQFPSVVRESSDPSVVRRSPDPSVVRGSPDPAQSPTEGLQAAAVHLRFLSRGFLWSEAKLAVVTDSEIFGRYKLVRPRRKFHQLAQAVDWTELQEGDFVVHVQHGIGKYLGLKSLEFNGAKQEVLAIEYADEARLYVPIDQAHLVSKYVGAGRKLPVLHHSAGLSGNGRNSPPSAIMDLAAGLLEIQAARSTLEGHAFSPDTAWADGPADLRRCRLRQDRGRDPRGVQGGDGRLPGRGARADDGAGRSSISTRSASAWRIIRSASNCSRGSAPAASSARVVKDLRQGAVDIVIGTHRLCSQTSHFKDLGLVVIDEEQRFGVLHKEKFKQPAHAGGRADAERHADSAHALSRAHRRARHEHHPDAAARPVAGRDHRHPVRRALIRDAIQRELNRGGQVFFLHNRVMTLRRWRRRLRRLLPHARIVSATARWTRTNSRRS